MDYSYDLYPLFFRSHYDLSLFPQAPARRRRITETNCMWLSGYHWYASFSLPRAARKVFTVSQEATLSRKRSNTKPSKV
jgi:hypothetical protein